MDLSFWEQSTFFGDIDLVVIGSGIVGLNTARAIKEKRPSWKIAVLDRGVLPYGASTRNAGFACFGSASELLDDLTKMSEDEVFGLVQRRWDGLARLRSVLGDEHLEYEPLGGYEMYTQAEKEVYQKCEEKLDYLNREIGRITKLDDIYLKKDNAIKDFGFEKVEHLILNKAEGQLNTGKMMYRLLNHVRSLGVDVYNGMSILGWTPIQDGYEIEMAEFKLKTKLLVVATNGFARELLPELQVEPGRAQVLVTEPIPDLKIKGSFHYDKGYYYFRNVGNRLLFGGGRNLDFATEKTTTFGLTPLVQNKLEELLRDVILPGQQPKIEQRWSGIMGLGPTKTTIVKKISKGLYCAVRMGGMGVAIGTLVGEEAADLVCAEN